MNRLIPFAACWLLMALSTAEAADEAKLVPRWQPCDFSFRADQKLDNPFSVAFAAEATGPGGIRLRIPGFYDGDGTWKVRLSPTIEGDWLYDRVIEALRHRGVNAIGHVQSGWQVRRFEAVDGGPRRTATWLRDSSTNGCDSTIVTSIGRSSSTRSPADQRRFNVT